MEKYKNRDGNSGVLSYESGKNSIIIQFSTGSKYLYNYLKPGKRRVEKMKMLAESGLGLSTYISRFVKEDYYERLD